MSSRGDYSDLSTATCEAVRLWARDGAPIPERAQNEIRANAKQKGAADPTKLIDATHEEMHLERAASILRRLNERTAEVRDPALKTEIWQWRLADKRRAGVK